MAESSTKQNIILTTKVILILVLFLGVSSVIGWWAHTQTSAYTGWGETVWEDNNWVGALVFGIGGTAGIVFVIFFLHRSLLRIFGKRTEGEVFNVEKRLAVMEKISDTYRAHSDTNPNLHMYKKEYVTVYAKSFRFTAYDGMTYEVESNVQTNQQLREGQKVSVLYNPRRPEKAKIYSHLEYYALVYLFLGMFITASVVGALMMELLD